jgi:hypothetical protein
MAASGLCRSARPFLSDRTCSQIVSLVYTHAVYLHAHARTYANTRDARPPSRIIVIGALNRITRRAVRRSFPLCFCPDIASHPLSLSLSRDIRGLEPRIGKTRGLTVGRAIFRRLWEKRGANARKRDSPRTEDAGGGGGRRKKKRGRR